MANNYATFENVSDLAIELHIDWDDGIANTNTTIKPGESAEITGFNGRTALACYRVDGGSYANCPVGSQVAIEGDFFRLTGDGGFVRKP